MGIVWSLRKIIQNNKNKTTPMIALYFFIKNKFIINKNPIRKEIIIPLFFIQKIINKLNNIIKKSNLLNLLFNLSILIKIIHNNNDNIVSG
jgi:hypothetical protein